MFKRSKVGISEDIQVFCYPGVLSNMNSRRITHTERTRIPLYIIQIAASRAVKLQQRRRAIVKVQSSLPRRPLPYSSSVARGYHRFLDSRDFAIRLIEFLRKCLSTLSSSGRVKCHDDGCHDDGCHGLYGCYDNEKVGHVVDAVKQVGRLVHQVF